MKKLFFYAAAALAMFASCKKADIEQVPSTTPIDDTTPVAMQFNVNAPSFSITKTKAAVDEWDNTEIKIYGLQRGNKGVVQTNKYNFDNILIEAYTTYVVDENTPLEVYQNPEETDQTKRAPYFYAEGQTYDFFAYHLGGLKEGTLTKEDDKIYFPVTITGVNDLMVAEADKENDIKDDTSFDGVTEDDVYSAWAARRGVHPTLVFEHALTRFNFIVRGMNDKAENLKITGISIPKLITEGTLTVVGETLGFVATGDVVEDGLALANLDAAKNAKDVVKGNTTPYEDCLMIAPNLKKIDVKVTMQHDTYESSLVKIDPYVFTVDASQVLKEGVAAGITKFEAGTAYNIYINVYGPEEIIIKAELTDWVDGGDYTYDPDQKRPGAETTSVTAERTVEGTVINYAISYTSDITAIQAAIAKETPKDADYQSLVDTRAATGISLDVANDEANIADYKLYVRYTTAEAKPAEDETENWTVVVDVQPEFIITKSYYVSNKTSYNWLPEAYRSHYGEWGANGLAESLPWLAVEYTPGATISGTATCGDKTYEIEKATSKIGLTTINAKELSIDSLTEGEWTITLNGKSTRIIVSKIHDAYLVHDETSYNKLPAEYRKRYGEWGANGLAESLPWLAVVYTPGATISGTATCGDFTYEIEEATSKIGLTTINAKEMGLDSLTAGEWTIELNGETRKIDVPAAE